MRILLRLLLAVVALLVIAAGLFYATTFAGLVPLPDRNELPGVGFVAKDGYAAFGVLDAGDGKLVLIDAGNDPSGAPVLAALGGHRPEDVVAVFLTHGHPDHVAAIPHLPAARVYGLAAEAPYLEGKLPWKGPLPSLFGAKDSGVRISDPVSDGSHTMVGTLDIETFAVPGHTPGSAAYLVGGALFLGDNATITKDGVLRPAPWVFSDDTAQNRGSLVALGARLASRAAEVRWLVPAHSGVAEGPAALLGYGG